MDNFETMLGNDGFLYYTMYCTDYTGTGIGPEYHCFLLWLSCSLSGPGAIALCMSNNRLCDFLLYAK